MGSKKGCYIRFVQEIIEKLCKGDTRVLEKYGNGMQLAVPLHNGFSTRSIKLREAMCCLSSGVAEVTHQDYYAVVLDKEHLVISGVFHTHMKANPSIRYLKQCYHVYAVIIRKKLSCLQIEPKNYIGKKLELHNLERESIFVWEDEILYIEAQRNHLYWHCRLDVVETTGTLQDIEKMLSDFFVRMHRSYIVNKTHIISIKKYQAAMDNGTVLQIPEKKYSLIKNKLTGCSVS